MKAVVLEKKGVINVREVPDTPAPAAGELTIAPHTVGGVRIRSALLHAWACGQIRGRTADDPGA